MCTHVDRLKAWLGTARLTRTITAFDRRGAIQTAGAHPRGFIAPTSTRIQLAHTVTQVRAPTCFAKVWIHTMCMSIQWHMHGLLVVHTHTHKSWPIVSPIAKGTNKKTSFCLTKGTGSSAWWTIRSGCTGVELSNGGTCITDGTGDYGNSESCVVEAKQTLMASATEFLTEATRLQD